MIRHWWSKNPTTLKVRETNEEAGKETEEVCNNNNNRMPEWSITADD